MKTYVITLSRNFLQGHPKAGEPTYFVEKFLKVQRKYTSEISEESGQLIIPKIHTIRGNYDLWEKRIAEVRQCRAMLSVRYWSGKPYHSKQLTLLNLTGKDGVGVQRLEQTPLGFLIVEGVDAIETPPIQTLAKNDGLSERDFRDWFRGYDLTKPMAIIHFTKFRY